MSIDCSISLPPPYFPSPFLTLYFHFLSLFLCLVLSLYHPCSLPLLFSLSLSFTSLFYLFLDGDNRSYQSNKFSISLPFFPIYLSLTFSLSFPGLVLSHLLSSSSLSLTFPCLPTSLTFFHFSLSTSLSLSFPGLPLSLFSWSNSLSLFLVYLSHFLSIFLVFLSLSLFSWSISLSHFLV